MVYSLYRIPGIRSAILRREIEKLDRLEHKATPQSGSGPCIHHEVLKKAKESLKHLSQTHFFPPRELRHFRLRIKALEYRLSSKNGGVDPKPIEGIEKSEGYKRIEKLASEWKKNYSSRSRKKDLTERDKKHLKELACYSYTLKKLLKDDEASSRAHCFKWIITCGLPPKAYVEHPKKALWIDDSYLKARIGKNVPNGLKLDTSKGFKDLTLLFETREGHEESISILDESKNITLSNNLTHSVGEIFKIFANKNLKESYLSVKKHGITNSSQNDLGAPVDGQTKLPILYNLKDPQLFSKLQRKFYTIEETKEYFKKQNRKLKVGFEENSINGKDLIFTVEIASQNGFKLDVSGSHASLVAWIPTENGYIRTDNIGKFTDYPQNGLDSIKTLTGVKRGYYQCKDNNQEYTHRKVVKKHFCLPAEKTERFLQRLKDDFQRAQDGKESFQILNNNCTDWIYTLVEAFVGPEEAAHFEVNFMDLKPRGPLSLAFKVAHLMSEKNRNRFFHLFTALLGGCRSTVIDGKKICLLDNPPWKRKFRHPAQFACYILETSSD